MSRPARPPLLPQPTPLTRPYWEAARRGALSIQRCRECARHVFYPRALCPHCGSDALEWVEASGRGRIHAFTVSRRQAFPGLDPPWVLAIVELDEGPHMTTNIVDCDPDAVAIGDRVEAVFAKLTDEITLVRFRPLAAA